jgi:protein-arginine kinase activator protein McsA
MINCKSCENSMIAVDRVEQDSVIIIFYYCENCDENYAAEYRFDELQKIGG